MISYDIYLVCILHKPGNIKTTAACYYVCISCMVYPHNTMYKGYSLIMKRILSLC